MPVVENIPRHPPEPTLGMDTDSARSPEWQLVQRIVASPAFVRSALLTNFLLYVCDRKLRGREDEITEHQIGVYALGRPDNYHPGEDNIVRNYARMLRKRLEEYFEAAGPLEELRILIPRGQYVPTFERAPVVQAAPPESELAGVSAGVAPFALETVPAFVPEAPAATGRGLVKRRNFLLGASAVAGVSALGWMGFRKTHANAASEIYDTFWSQLFNPNRECFVVTGDSGLVLVERLTGHDISLNEYGGGSLSSSLEGLSLTSTPGKRSVPAGTLHFTSTADLNVAIAMDRRAMGYRVTPKIRNARDMRIGEVKKSNGIFIGGPRANPWIELFAPRSNFYMKFYSVDGADRATQSIWNKRARAGERQEYLNSTDVAPYSTFTMVSFLPSMDDEGWVLLLQGQNLSGTGAAGEFVSNMSALAPVLTKAKKPDGSIGPFEVILETQVIGTDSKTARIVVERYGLLKPS